MNQPSAKSPLVSVVIPVYNRPAMVVEAIESVLVQTFTDFELIVVDDGSDDGTPAALAPYEDRALIIRQQNGGVSAARNSGLKPAKGTFVAFLDSDDLWAPEKLAVQVSYMATFPKVALCHTEEIWMRNGRRVNARKHHRKARGNAFSDLLRDSLISPSAVMMKKSLLEEEGGFDESLPACEDFALWLSISRTQDIHLIDRALVVKRGGHSDQLSRLIWGLDRFRVKVLRDLLADSSLSPADTAETSRVLKEKYRILAEGSRKRGKKSEAAEYTRLAAEVPP